MPYEHYTSEKMFDDGSKIVTNTTEFEDVSFAWDSEDWTETVVFHIPPPEYSNLRFDEYKAGSINGVCRLTSDINHKLYERTPSTTITKHTSSHFDPRFDL